MREYFNESAATRILFPIDGDFVNERDGAAAQDGVTVTVTVAAAPGSRVTVEDVPAAEDTTQSGVFCATVLVKAGQNTLRAHNLTDGTEATVSVYYLPEAMKKYRISSDDNILFLADITANKDVYTSIFDNPYLAVYKKAHDLYGAKVHLNLFYAFDRDAAKYFAADRPDFDLSMVTDKFKAEWEANADWLTLSFHARQEFPPKPYQFAAPETITEDFLAVKREVLRFAGEKTFSEEVTTVHFGEANIPCTEALRELGHKALAGYFEVDKHGDPLVAYYAPMPLIDHVGERDFWRDTVVGMNFARIDRVTNLDTLEKIMEDMHAILAHPHRGGFVSFMIHEQYFYGDYKRYLPDFEARVLEPARLLYENGYTGCFLRELLSF